MFMSLYAAYVAVGPSLIVCGAGGLASWSISNAVLSLRAKSRARLALRQMHPDIRTRIEGLLNGGLSPQTLDLAAAQLDGQLMVLAPQDRERLHPILYQRHLIARRSSLLELLPT